MNTRIQVEHTVTVQITAIDRLPPQSALFPYTTLFRSCPAIAAITGFFSSVRDGPIGPSPSGSRRKDRKSTRLNSSHVSSSYAVFCLKKKKRRHGGVHPGPEPQLLLHRDEHPYSGGAYGHRADYCDRPATPAVCTLSLHDALPILPGDRRDHRLLQQRARRPHRPIAFRLEAERSEEHTSELQSRFELVCRLLLEKKKTPARWSSSWTRTATSTSSR